MTSSFAGDPPAPGRPNLPDSGSELETGALSAPVSTADPEPGPALKTGPYLGTGPNLDTDPNLDTGLSPDTGPNLGTMPENATGVAYYSIGDLANAFGVTTRAIRFYEAKNLITPERKGTARLYSRRDRARLQMILRGKNLGFSLEEIREFLDLYDADPTQTVQARHVLGKVEVAMTELENKRADIERTLTELAEIRAQCVAHLESEGQKS